MDSPRAPRFGLGVYWPDDYTDYLVHFHEPTEIFRLEVDGGPDEPIVLWAAPDSPYETIPDADFDAFARAVRRYLGEEELVELGTQRRIELRITEVPFPPLLMVSNRAEKFHAIVGLGEEPFTAYLNNDASDPLIDEVVLGFESDSPLITQELADFCENYYHEFYDRQELLEKRNKEKRSLERRGTDLPFSRN